MGKNLFFPPKKPGTRVFFLKNPARAGRYPGTRAATHDNPILFTLHKNTLKHSFHYFQQTISEQRQLKCWYHKEYAWLYIRGIGVERIHVSPEVLYFRNVLTDHEIDVLKKLGQPKVNTFILIYMYVCMCMCVCVCVCVYLNY